MEIIHRGEGDLRPWALLCSIRVEGMLPLDHNGFDVRTKIFLVSINRCKTRLTVLVTNGTRKERSFGANGSQSIPHLSLRDGLDDRRRHWARFLI